jgi:predicted transcriptional regulator
MEGENTDPMTFLNVSLPQSLKERLQRLAELEDRPLSSFARIILARAADQIEAGGNPESGGAR